MKNKWLATALNLIPGVGYLYIGGARKVFGIMLLSIWPVAILATIIDPEYANSSDGNGTFYIWDLMMPLIIEAAFMVDAYIEAQKHNQVEALSPKQRATDKQK